MMENSNIYWYAMSDKALLSVLGTFLRDIRLQQNKNQQEVAIAAGISRSTLIVLENGGGGSLLTFIELMRTLDQLHLFANFVVRKQVSPLQLAKVEQGKRQRAKKTNNSQKGKDSLK
jgi:transcriptional regulator with XRE-family HTH domain